MQFMTNELNISPALTCPPKLGGGSSGGGGFDEGPPVGPNVITITLMWKREPYNPPGNGNGNGSPMPFLDDEFIFFKNENWIERVAEIFAHGEPGAVEERFTSILAQSELFAIERFDHERAVVLHGNHSTFFDAN
jgi:hypothetical protein